ncbi:MAG: 4-(cytidine 5'-diphospho)-2-C-methyl-D-erythritol kinase [Proteobacteria bacterium]|nr:4-(cytidine 5'-diphospho)-2-C-methyl-D-erythritol kinase [Pseudomonadota bacterium]
MLRVFAPAKINLFLHVGDRRSDGYHELESLAVFADVGDTLKFEPADTLSLAVEGPFAASLAGEADNLVLRTARGVAQIAQRALPRKITLTKNLPVAAGVGGGSSDAAATLRALLLQWEGDQVVLDDFVALASELGSDVPVCFFGQSSWMAGRGDDMARASVPPLHAVLVNPGVSIATRDVFAELRERTGIGAGEWPERFETAQSLFDFLRTTKNDLEAPALGLAPQIGEALRTLRSVAGIELARMSGSGATCFGLFPNEAMAKNAAASIAASRPNWWVKSAQLAPKDPED